MVGWTSLFTTMEGTQTVQKSEKRFEGQCRADELLDVPSVIAGVARSPVTKSGGA